MRTPFWVNERGECKELSAKYLRTKYMYLNPIKSFKNLEVLVFLLHVVFPPFLQCCFSHVTLKSNLNIGRGRGGKCMSASRIFVAGLQIGHILHSKLFTYSLVINQASIIIPLVLRIFRIKPSISFRIVFDSWYFFEDMLKILILISCFVFNPFSGLSVHIDYHTLINGEFRSCAGFISIKTDRHGLPVKLRNGHSLGSTNLSVEVLITRKLPLLCLKT